LSATSRQTYSAGNNRMSNFGASIDDLNLPPTSPTVVKGSILIVDDHHITAAALEKLLVSAGYRAQIAHNGSDALAKAAAARPIAAIIDIHLPDLNGLVLSKKLREQFGPDVPLIMLSGDTSMATINSLPHVGATYFLSKPIHAAHFLEMLKTWLPGDAIKSS
jgi:CheY-like chemotaxis protein